MEAYAEISYKVMVSQKELRLIGRALAGKLKSEDKEAAHALNIGLLEQLEHRQKEMHDQTVHALELAHKEAAEDNIGNQK